MAKVKTALLSVSDKTGIVAFAKFLAKQGIALLSTGGTAKALRAAGLKVIDVSTHTGAPEIMDGRVKTLHPKIHGGILGKRSSTSHQKAMKQEKITPIDLVVVNLYPFEDAVARGADTKTCIEHIDIGGPSMIRSAAKNHDDVIVVTDPADYILVQDALTKKGEAPLVLKQMLAAKAFARTAAYDAAITRWFAAQQKEPPLPDTLNVSGLRTALLRYGENPHQQAALYVDKTQKGGIAQARQIQGKELSYNNLADADAALELVNEFSVPAVAIIKHANPCGVAVAKNLATAYDKALVCDPVSAYGSIIAVNRTLDAATAEKISALFVEVVVAPNADKKALAILEKKKNLRLLLTGTFPNKTRKDLQVKTISGGILVQERDFAPITEKMLKIVSKKKPDKKIIAEMLFAFTVCKHVKSNAIVLTQGGATVGIGAGQMSRVDAVNMAAQKAKGLGKTSGLTLASDAFFPFADGVELAATVGVTSVIHPGSSIRDDEVIEAANKHGMAMVFTGQRHFKH